MFLCANKIFNEDLSRSKVYYNLSDIPKITQLLNLYVDGCYAFNSDRIKAIEETKIYTECLADDGKYEFLAVDAPVDVNKYLSSKLNGVKR